MKQNLKKMISMLLVISMVISISYEPVYGASGNTSIPTAIAISDNVNYSDIVEEINTKYYYKWTASKSGVVNFSFGRNDYTTTETPNWSMYIYTSTMTRLDYGTYKADWTSSNYTVQAGDTYYLELRGEYGSCKENAYYVCANFTDSPFVEIESNDSASNATKLTMGNTYIGCITTSSDKDFYKITAPKSGYVKIDMERYDYTTTVDAKWNFALYDSNLNELYSVGTTLNGNNKNTSEIYYALAKGKAVYIKISDYSSSMGILYSLKATFKATSNVETEPNNDYSAADKMKIGTTYYGVMGETNTSDYYYFKAGSTAKYKIGFSLSKDVNYGYRIKIYDSSRKLVASTNNKIYKSGSCSFKAKKGKKYYVVIEHAEGGFFGGYTVGTLYKLKVAKK